MPTILYNSSLENDKQTVVYTYVFSDSLQTVDFKYQTLEARYWRKILKMIETEPSELLDKTHPEYQNVVNSSRTQKDWISALHQNPQLLKSPILIRKSKAYLLNEPKDVYSVMAA